MRIEPLETLIDVKVAIDHCIALAKLTNHSVIVIPTSGSGVYLSKENGDRARLRAAGEFYRYSVAKGLPRGIRNKIVPLQILSEYVKKSGVIIVIERGGTVRFKGEAIEVKELVDQLVKPWEYFSGT